MYTRLETGYNIAVNSPGPSRFATSNGATGNGATGIVVVVQVDKGPGTKWNSAPGLIFIHFLSRKLALDLPRAADRAQLEGAPGEQDHRHLRDGG